MLLLVVRHAHAGSKTQWLGDDALRPLTERGHQQAAGMVDRLAAFEPSRIVSSPMVRCVQTVRPLAIRLGCSIEVAAALGPTAGARAAAFVREVDEGSGPIVLCTHGETIEALQAQLGPAAGGSSAFKPGGVHEKGSVWALHARAGTLTAAEYYAPARPGEQLAPSASEH